MGGEVCQSLNQSIIAWTVICKKEASKKLSKIAKSARLRELNFGFNRPHITHGTTLHEPIGVSACTTEAS